VFDQLRNEVEAALAKHRVPGVALGVLHEGRVETAAWGVTSVEHPLPVDADTLFLIASNTKTFTATAVMRLVERGKLDLDAPLKRFVPELKLGHAETTERATLRHTLQHTGGWVGDFSPDTGRGDDALARYVAAMAENEQSTPLGEVWSYNNAAFCLAGRAIEVATGLSYEAAMRELVLDPLDMVRATFFADEAITHRVAAGHNVVGDDPKVVRPWHFIRAFNPAGGLICSLNEMLRWVRFGIGDGAPLLRPESMRLMQSSLAPAYGLADAIGLAWMISDVGGARVVGHGGYAPGQMSSTRLVPDRGFGVVVLANSDHGARLHGEVTNAALRLYLGTTAPDRPRIEATAAQRAELVGRYGAALADLEVVAEGDGLVLRVTEQRWLGPTSPTRDLPPPTRLAFTAEDRLVALDAPTKGTRAEVLRDASGQVEWLRWGGRIHRRR
jgi:CubicO group peptidase (beta-lactamase class C family)